MSLIEYDDSSAYFDAALPLWLSDEPKNTMPYGLGIQFSRERGNKTNHIMIIVFRKDRPVATFCRASYYPNGCISAIDEAHRAAAIDILTDHLRPIHRTLAIETTSGPMPEAELFAQAFVKKNSSSFARYAAKMKAAFYTLTQIDPQFKSRASGQMVTATLDQLDTVVQLVREFNDELKFPHSSKLVEMQRDRVSRQLVFLWMSPEGKPACIATLTGETKNSYRIGAVYTVPDERQKGFASSLTAALCRHILATKSYCILGADTDNAVTNRMYQAIGFKFAYEGATMEYGK